MSCWMSSSRVHTTFTGPATCFAIRTAWMMKSTSSRRPKPPPSRWLWTRTLLFGSPVSFAAAVWAKVGTCVPTQMSQPSGRTWTVQFAGSSVACARNGTSYTASTFCAAPAMALVTSPSLRATTPGCAAATASCCTMSAVVSLALGPSSHWIASAARPCFAEPMGAAKQGLAALTIQWDEGPNAKLTTADIVQQLAVAAAQPGVVARNDGDVTKAMAGAAQKVEAVYEVPFLAHATLEPANCTVHVRPDGCDIWVGTQVPTFAQTAAAKLTGLPKSKVRVHNHLLGGGFGRRLEVDFIIQAVRIAKQVAGPVKVVWTREEDIQHDMYRPYYYDRLAAGLNERGVPIAWTHRVAGSSIMARVVSELFPKTLRVMRAAGLHQLVAMVKGLDVDAVEGAADPPYALPNIRVEYVRQEPPGIPTAFWRGVGPTHNIFVVESFIDELAAAAKQDPFEYRRVLLDQSPRAKAVLELAAEQAGWGQPLPAGRGRGISLLHAFGETYIAQVAEVSVSSAGDVRVHRVVCAVDCGIIVNPDTVRAQMESGIIFGITAALFGEITIKNGRVEQHNFNDYRMLRINEAPVIDVHPVKSTEPPGGIGEPGTSAVMPAVTNAIFAATGKRIRKLPVGAQLRST